MLEYLVLIYIFHLNIYSVEGDFTSQLTTFADTVKQSCKATIIGNIATVGDSRSWQVSTDPKFILGAKLDRKLILKPDQLILQDRSQPGSQSKHWVDKIKNCLSQGQDYDLPLYTVIHMGGNDALADVYKKKKELRDQYELVYPPILVNPFLDFLFPFASKLLKAMKALRFKSLIKNPFRTMRDFLANVMDAVRTLRPPRSIKDTISQFGGNGFDAYWEWYLGSETDRIAGDMYYVSNHILSRPNRKLLFNTIPPASYQNADGVPSLAFAYRTEDRLSRNDYPELLKIFSLLHGKYKNKIFPLLASQYPDKIVLIDAYGLFISDIFKDKSSMYLDGIHFNKKGLEQWGTFIAMGLVTSTWLSPNIDIDTSAWKSFLGDMELNAAKIFLNLKAVEIGLPSATVDLNEVIVGESSFEKNFARIPSGSTIGGLPSYQDKGLFQKQGDYTTFAITGKLLDRYRAEGGVTGRLGFPLADQWSEHFGTILKATFECGAIHYNTLDLLHPDGYLYMTESSEECKDKKVRDAN